VLDKKSLNAGHRKERDRNMKELLTLAVAMRREQLRYKGHRELEKARRPPNSDRTAPVIKVIFIHKERRVKEAK